MDEPKYDAKWSADDPDHGCIVDKIKEFMATLKDPRKTTEQKRFALRFLIHCVEDLHQPFHLGNNSDRNGNDTQVRYFDRGTNMHRLWDSTIIDRVSTSEAVWLKDVAAQDSPQALQDARTGGVEDWATESLLAAREASVNPMTGMRIKPGAKLGLDYHNKNIPVVKERMYRAGIRLAKVLNECFE